MKPHLSLFLRLALLMAGLVTTVSAAVTPRPVRLYEIAVVKFITVNGQTRLHEGQLLATGGFRLAHDYPTATPAPAGYDGKNLIFTEAWYAFKSLGPDAVANFELRSNEITIAGLIYYEVGPREDAVLNVGQLTNLSSRGLVTNDERLIAGFVIDESHRRVLIRAVGPSLAAAGVNNALSDPYLTIFQGNTGLHYNGDWSASPDAAEIAQVSARVGAFPLAANSKDSVLLVELPPGVYSAHVEPETGAGGVVLLEVYRVPE